MLSNVGQTLSSRLYRIDESCLVANACSPGSTQVEWAPSTSGMPGYERGRKDKRGNWEAYEYQPFTTGSGRVAPVQTAVRKGALNATGASALEEKLFSYEADGNGQPRLKSEQRPSLLGPANSKAQTTKRYDASGRIAAATGITISITTTTKIPSLFSMSLPIALIKFSIMNATIPVSMAVIAPPFPMLYQQLLARLR